VSKEPAGPAAQSPASRGKPELVPIPGNVSDGAMFVRQEAERAERDGQKLVVYVGAAWCEPCQAFHHALERGELDQDLAGVRFLDFDLDRHEELLRQAGCTSKLIPLFARPSPEGTCSDRRTEGGIKGDKAVGFLLDRLRKIL
jgi:thiol-disulfide isomerase/thioredoxin